MAEHEVGANVYAYQETDASIVSVEISPGKRAAEAWFKFARSAGWEGQEGELFKLIALKTIDALLRLV